MLFQVCGRNKVYIIVNDIIFTRDLGVLNDPVKRVQSTSKPSKAEVPPVARASIPKVKPSDFDTYLEHIRPVFERYQANKQSEEEEYASPTLNDTTTNEELPIHQRPSTRNPYGQVLSSDSLALVDPVPETPSPVPRELPMLENVPPIFFDPDFHLEDPRTFDQVCEGADITGNSGPNPPISTNSILQEKLSYYLDTVEVHLIREIENRSSSFFEALSNLQALHQETLDCVSQIHAIRKMMKEIQTTTCYNGLDVVRLRVRERNLNKLNQAVELVKEVHSAQPKIQVLLGQGDYFGALDLIDETRGLLAQQDGIDLSKVRALGDFASQLDEMEKAVGVMMQHDFLSILLSDLSYQMESINYDEEKKTWPGAKINAGAVQPDNELQNRLKSSSNALLRTNMLGSTLQGYRERLLSEIKEIVRKKYPPSSPNDDGT